MIIQVPFPGKVDIWEGGIIATRETERLGLLVPAVSLTYFAISSSPARQCITSEKDGKTPLTVSISWDFFVRHNLLENGGTWPG
jgi:hypothetical protein